MPNKIDVLMINGTAQGKVLAIENELEIFRLFQDGIHARELITYKLCDFIASGRVFRIGISNDVAVPADGVIQAMILDGAKIGFTPYKTTYQAPHEISTVEKQWWYAFELMQDKWNQNNR